MKLAPLRHRDINACVTIERRLFAGDSPWNATAFASELDSGAHYLGGYDDSGRLIGYGGVAVVGVPAEYEAEIHTMAVQPESQGTGVGSALLDALLEHADRHDAPTFLEVRTDNEHAQRLYESRGFVTIGRRRHYYRPSGADAYTMRRPASTEQRVEVGS